MTEQKKTKDDVEQSFAMEIVRERKKIIQRLVGAGVVFVFTLLLWHYGSTFPPQFKQTEAKLPFPLAEEVIEWEEPKPIVPLIEIAELEPEPELKIVKSQEEETSSEKMVKPEPKETNDEIFDANIQIIEADTTVEKSKKEPDEKPQVKEKPVLKDKTESVEEKKTEALDPIWASFKEPVKKPLPKPIKFKERNTDNLLPWPSAKGLDKKTTFQVGSFKDENNAKQFAKALTKLHLTVEIKKQASFHRVFVKNVNSIAELREINQHLANLSNNIEKSLYAVQVGAFSQSSRVQKIIEHLKAEGYKVQVQPTTRKGVKISRIRVVGLNTQEAAETTRLQLITKGYNHSTVINLK